MTESSPTEQTNALLAAVVASSMDAVFSIDTNARIQSWNSAAEQLYGYTAAEAIGQPLGLLAPDPTNYAPGTRFQRVLQGEQIYFETSRRRKDGSLVEVGISYVGQFGTRVGTWLVYRSSIATYPNASAPSVTCARCTNGSSWHKKQGMSLRGRTALRPARCAGQSNCT